MSAIKPIIRQARQAVLDGMAHAKNKLHRLADNMNDHLDNVVKQVRDKDKFDDKTGPVKEFDTGTYKDLQSRETVGDALQHDHIPSSAALRRAREIELNRELTRAERRALHNDGVAVELSDLLHSLSRTFKNNNTKAQIELDASDLAAAMNRDLGTLRDNLLADGRLSRRQVDSVLQEIRDLNLKRGIG
jgi:hypothetical protein